MDSHMYNVKLLLKKSMNVFERIEQRVSLYVPVSISL